MFAGSLLDIVNNCIKLKLPLTQVGVEYFAVNLKGVHKIWLENKNHE